MEHIYPPSHPRAQGSASHGRKNLPEAARTEDPRWTLLDLVRTCRTALSLRDRDIAVLRGLLSLVPAPADPARLVVFASNKVMIERCDGMDERTLRRRIVHLQSKGLLSRRLSPNGKRYQVRDEEAQAQLTYGIDLAPLFALRSHIKALAGHLKVEEIRINTLRAQIRDTLFHRGGQLPPQQAQEARLSLRRVISSERLQAVLDGLSVPTLAPTTPAADPIEMSASDSQNDRHIQSSDKETYESEGCNEDQADRDRDAPVMPARRNAVEDLTVTDCIELAPGAVEMAISKPRTWEDLIDLSSLLAQAIGLSRKLVGSARQHLGPHGAALAILGLVEAFGRIRNPEAYLASLTQRAQRTDLNFVRMFRSLVRPRRPAIHGVA